MMFDDVAVLFWSIREWNALSTTSLRAGWMCIPLNIGCGFCSGVYIRFIISCMRTEAYDPMMCAPKIFCPSLNYDFHKAVFQTHGLSLSGVFKSLYPD